MKAEKTLKKPYKIPEFNVTAMFCVENLELRTLDLCFAHL